MSDWTEAVRKYEEAWTCHNYHYGWLVEKDKADAAIAELLDAIERLKCCGNCGYLFDDCGQGLCGWANPSPTQVGSPHVNFADPCFRAPSRWKEAER